MYWLLLPLDANAKRHFVDETGPSSGYLLRTVWARLLRSLGLSRD